jgi:excisionase family DNA binding protein
MASSDNRLWSPADVSEYLGVPVATLYKWRQMGEGPPGFRIGKHIRWRPQDVEAWLETRRDDVVER